MVYSFMITAGLTGLIISFLKPEVCLSRTEVNVKSVNTSLHLLPAPLAVPSSCDLCLPVNSLRGHLHVSLKSHTVFLALVVLLPQLHKTFPVFYSSTS